MMQTFAVFADDPTIAKTKTAKSFNSRVGTALCRALLQNQELLKFLLERLVAFLQKFAPAEISRYTVCATNETYQPSQR